MTTQTEVVLRAIEALDRFAKIKADDGDDFSSYQDEITLRCEITVKDLRLCREALTALRSLPAQEQITPEPSLLKQATQHDLHAAPVDAQSGGLITDADRLAALEKLGRIISRPIGGKTDDYFCSRQLQSELKEIYPTIRACLKGER
jgi:hypothetical protein